MPRIAHAEWWVPSNRAAAGELQRRLPVLRTAGNDIRVLSPLPDILVAGSHVSRTRAWSEALGELAGIAPWQILYMRTFSGTPTTLTTCRDVGSSTRRPYWVVNQQDLRAALERAGLKVERQIVLPDPVRIPGIPELADHRLFLVSANVHRGER